MFCVKLCMLKVIFFILTQEAKISVLELKIDAIRVGQQEMKDQQGHLVRMLVDSRKHVTVMKHSQVNYDK